MKQDAAATFDFIQPMKALPGTDLPVGDWLVGFPSDTVRALMAKINAFTCRWAPRSSDSTVMFKSVFLLISAMATSNAVCRRLAQTGKGAYLMIFPEASLID